MHLSLFSSAVGSIKTPVTRFTGRDPLVEKRCRPLITHTHTHGPSASGFGVEGKVIVSLPFRDGVFVRASESKHKRIAAKHNKRRPIKRKPLRASHLSFTLTLFHCSEWGVISVLQGYWWCISHLWVSMATARSLLERRRRRTRNECLSAFKNPRRRWNAILWTSFQRVH